MDTASGTLGWISIVCWVVVFTPQIVKNYRLSSAEGLSIQFLLIWLLGDICNTVAAVMQGVLPTMIALALYYTFADGVLIIQYIYYRQSPVSAGVRNLPTTEQTERSGLLEREGSHRYTNSILEVEQTAGESEDKTPSNWHERNECTTLEPCDNSKDSMSEASHSLVDVQNGSISVLQASTAASPEPQFKTLQTTWFLLVVILSGLAAWYIARIVCGASTPYPDVPELAFNRWAQLSGYICAALYIASRIPQLLLNHRRKSTSGISLFFFLFAFLGNLTYVLSIFAHVLRTGCLAEADGQQCSTGEVKMMYRRHLLINMSWIIGGIGTPMLDLIVFGQFLAFRKKDGIDMA